MCVCQRCDKIMNFCKEATKLWLFLQKGQRTKTLHANRLQNYWLFLWLLCKTAIVLWPICKKSQWFCGLFTKIYSFVASLTNTHSLMAYSPKKKFFWPICKSPQSFVAKYEFTLY